MTEARAPNQRTLRPDSFETDDGKNTGAILTPFMRDVGNLFSGGISWGQMRCIERELTFTMPSLWTTATLASSWVAEAGYGAPAYQKDASGIVRLRGAADSGTYGASAIMTLPASCWPSVSLSFPAVQSNATFEPAGRINISTAGVVTAPAIVSIQTGVSTFLGFDGITFQASDATEVAFPAPFPCRINISALKSPARDVLATYCYDTTDRASVPHPMPQLAWETTTYTRIPMLAITQAWGLREGRTYRIGFKIFA